MPAEKMTILVNRGDLPSHSDEHFQEWIKSKIEGWAIDLDNPLVDIELSEVTHISDK